MTQKKKSTWYMIGSAIIIISFFLTWYNVVVNASDVNYHDTLPVSGLSLAQVDSGVWLILIAGIVAFLLGLFTLKEQKENAFTKLLKSGLQITKVVTILWTYFSGIASGQFSRGLASFIGDPTVNVQYLLQWGFWLVVIGICMTAVAVWYPGTSENIQAKSA